MTVSRTLPKQYNDTRLGKKRYLERIQQDKEAKEEVKDLGYTFKDSVAYNHWYDDVWHEWYEKG